MDIDRRQVLSAGLVALVVPGWLSACHRDGQARGVLGQALRQASEKGRPLLVLRIENDPERDADLGALVGTFLMHASDDQVAALAGCELVCATTQALHSFAPEALWPGDVRAVLVKPDGEVRRAILGSPPPVEWTGLFDESHEQHLRSVHARHDWLARQLADALDAERGPRPDESDAEHGAHLASLAATTRAQWDPSAPGGSTWAVSTGCGVELECDRGGNSMTACGMGFTPAISRRFLHFFTRGERAL